MQNVLVINSSISGGKSVSRLLVDEVVAQLTRHDPTAKIVERDLGRQPVPHLTTDTLAAVQGVPGTEVEQQARALSDHLIAELREANTIVIGAPMYNFSIPTGLRAWFDHVLRSGETFSYSAAGLEGLLGGRRVVVVESRGGLYSEGPGQAADFQEPYLRQMLAFVGITDITFIHAEKIGFGPEARAEAIESAKARIAELVMPQSRAA